jgi:hypothetical protein
MRRIVLAVVAAGVLFTASRSAAQQTSYTFDAFTFDPATALLVGTVGDCLGDVCQTVYLTANPSTVFLPPDPVVPPNPFYGLFTAWNAVLAYLPPNPIVPPNPFFGLLVALGHGGARALVTTIDGTTLASFQPLEPLGGR